MFKISVTSKRGGIWDGNKVVREFETDNAEIAKSMKSRRCTVTEISLSIETMTVAQLKQYAKDNGIDLGDAAKKDKILEIIKSAEAE